MLYLGTASPAGSGNAVIASAASAPFVRATLTGMVALKPCGTSIGVEGVSKMHRQRQGRRRDQAEVVDAAHGNVVLLRVDDLLARQSLERPFCSLRTSHELERRRRGMTRRHSPRG